MVIIGQHLEMGGLSMIVYGFGFEDWREILEKCGRFWKLGMLGIYEKLIESGVLGILRGI